MKLNNRQQIALTKVINYLYTEEEKHFEELLQKKSSLFHKNSDRLSSWKEFEI